MRTTRIYCRPSCPARTPQPQNVTFFRTSAAAHEAGYRACKRCLPEAVPGTPEWDLRQDVAARAMRLLRDGVVDREGVDGLALRLGYSTRHVHRLLVAELGAGPVALARAQRAQTARALLTETPMAVADVAFAAGFGSIRQFNDTLIEVFGRTPSELRSRAHQPAKVPVGRTPSAHASQAHGSEPGRPTPGVSEPGTPTPSALTLTSPFREPYDAQGMLRFLAARAVDGIEEVDIAGGRYTRSLALPQGPGTAEVSLSPDRCEVRLELAVLADLPAAIARLRRLLDLDADPMAVDEVLRRDPALAESVSAVPGIRVPGAVDGAEIVMRALIGQQISVAAARTHLSRLATLGTPITTSLGPTRLFPTAQQIADDGHRVLRGPAARIASILGAARAIAAGDLDPDPAADPAELRTALLRLPGVGPWTAGYVAMRVLHDPDVLLATDGALLVGAHRLGLSPGTGSTTSRARALAGRGERWAPWRSYASMHLWRAAAAPGPADRAPSPPPADRPAPVAPTGLAPITTPLTWETS